MYLLDVNLNNEDSYLFNTVSELICFIRDTGCNFYTIWHCENGKYVEELEKGIQGVIFRTCLFKKTELLDFYNSIVGDVEVVFNKALVKYYVGSEAGSEAGSEGCTIIENPSMVKNDFLVDVRISIEYFCACGHNFYLYLCTENGCRYCEELDAGEEWGNKRILVTNCNLNNTILKLYNRCCTFDKK